MNDNANAMTAKITQKQNKPLVDLISKCLEKLNLNKAQAQRIIMLGNSFRYFIGEGLKKLLNDIGKESYGLNLHPVIIMPEISDPKYIGIASEGQLARIIDLCRDQIRLSPFKPEEVKRLMMHKSLMEEKLKFVISGLLSCKFGDPVAVFEFTVPNDFDSDTYLDDCEKHFDHTGGRVCIFKDSVNSRNFSQVSHKLQPNKKYRAEIVPAPKTFGYGPMCLSYYRETKALYVGAQGLVLIYNLKKKEFPRGRTGSFDVEKNLWLSPEKKYQRKGRRVPYVDNESIPYNPSNMPARIGAGYFDSFGINGGFILCVYELGDAKVE